MRRLLVLLLAVGLLGAGATAVDAKPRKKSPRLHAFRSCTNLLGYAQRNGLRVIRATPVRVAPVPPDSVGGGGDDDSGSGGGGIGGPQPVAGPAPAPAPGERTSSTNVQEAGVDEPDLIKTDGERILAIAQGNLHFVDTSGATPTKRGSLELGTGGWEAQMFLHEDRVLLLLRDYYYDYNDAVPEPGFDDDGGSPELPPEQQGPDLGQYFPGDVGALVRLVEVDISDPDNLRVVSNLFINGDLLNARMIDGVARVVVRSQPTGLEFKDPWEFFNWDAVEEPGGDDAEPFPGTITTGASPTSASASEPGSSGSAEAEGGSADEGGEAMGFRDGEPADPYEVEYQKALAEAKLHNLAVVEQSKTADWLPKYVLEDLSSGSSVFTQGLLLECTDVKHPGDYSGLSTLSVLTVDLTQSLALGKGVGVFAEGETVYASKENLYVTTTPWRPEVWSEDPIEGGGSGEGFTSYVHKFSLADAVKADYVASGSVRGRVRSQWSLSEHAGDLRLATTDQLGWDTATAENFVSVLRQDGDELVQIGQVGGLGAGEEIHGVRFIGNVGYVVTFRQTDPLYTIDLHEPADPKMLGELKIPGYSAYLHPISEDLILGVGLDGTDDGQLLGMQLSLFDVSDLNNPTRIHTASVGDDWGWSEALFDPKAFLYWQKTSLALLPVEWYTWDEASQTQEGFTGALGYTIDAEAGIVPLGSIEHPVQIEPEYTYASAIRRSMVIGDQVLTLSDEGLKASRVTDLGDQSFIEF
jgi:hypothetical protein